MLQKSHITLLSIVSCNYTYVNGKSKYMEYFMRFSSINKTKPIRRELILLQRNGMAVKNNGTRFKTIVINGTKIKIITKILCAAAAALTVWGIAGLFSVSKQQLALSDSFYKTVISSELHSNEEHMSPGDFIRAALGFDIKDAKSIIGEYSPIFSEKLAAKITPTPAPEQPNPPKPSAESTPPPEEKPIAESHSVGEMKISNRTSIDVNADALANEPLGFKVNTGGEPQILILHTHTTESFTDSDTNKYLTSESDRNLDESKNIVAVGNAMADVFNSKKIMTVHDTTVHDYPSFNGAYTRAMATIKANLAAAPTIKIVLDVHRDGIVREDGTKVKVACDISGEKTAQCMFVVGSNAVLTHDNWRENMKLACKIQRKANQMYPGLMRPIILREERFNQQASTGSLIIEVGSNGNTLDEAIRGGTRMAEVISALLTE